MIPTPFSNQMSAVWPEPRYDETVRDSVFGERWPARNEDERETERWVPRDCHFS
jgi:hypothetical protein